MTEYWDLYRADRQKTGRVMARGTRVPAGLYHIAVDIWLRDADGRILLTKRHPRKSFGGLWECTGGAVIAGEEPAAAAAREIREEIGVTVASAALTPLGTETGLDWMVDSFLFADFDAGKALTLKADEVVGAKWATVDEFWQMNRAGEIVASVARRFSLYRDAICQIQRAIL